MSLLLAFACGSGAPDTPLPADAPAPVDVLVIGSGPAGAAAAWKARQDGAEVVVLERDARAGGAGLYAANHYGAATRWHAEAGIDDSASAAAEDWRAHTGGDPADPWVQLLFERSGEIISWLVDDLGAEFQGFAGATETGGTPRMHRLGRAGSELAPVSLLTEGLDEAIRLQHQADALLVEQGAVVGASYTDLRTGEQGQVRAKAVVVATGGFARHTERVLEVRPELSPLTLHVEAGPSSDGGGLVLFEGLEVREQNLAEVGVYTHSVADPRKGFEGEVLWPVPSVKHALIVDLAGRRVADEGRTTGFDMVDALLAAPDRRLVALVPDALYPKLRAIVPPYNRKPGERRRALPATELTQLGALATHADVASAAAHWGMPAEVLTATVQRYDEHVAAGRDADFGKDPAWLVGFGDRPVHAMELVVATAKTFGGVALDEQARVLGVDGPIPGLWAAGEVAGMLGTEAIGEGLDGAITACYLTGLVAGEQAAAAARGEAR